MGGRRPCWKVSFGVLARLIVLSATVSGCGHLFRLPSPDECCRPSIADDASYYVGPDAAIWAWYRINPSLLPSDPERIDRVRYRILANEVEMLRSLRAFVQEHPGSTAKDFFVRLGMECRPIPGASTLRCTQKLAAFVFCTSFHERPDQLRTKYAATYSTELHVSGASIVRGGSEVEFPGGDSPCRRLS